jgi:hypothetical protein
MLISTVDSFSYHRVPEANLDQDNRAPVPFRFGGHELGY